MKLMTAKTDRQIHDAVLQELKWDTQVDETEVGVEVGHGVVTLTGTVGNYAKKLGAQEAAHRVEGVLDVANDIQIHIHGAMQHTDTEIAEAVRRVLSWNVFIPHEQIQTTVSNGWVLLEGSVPYLIDRITVEKAVSNLNGLKGVTNNLVVSSPAITPNSIRESIEKALDRRAKRESDSIQVDVKDGTVWLTGRVHNWNEKQAVLGAAGFASGVRRVEDHLRVDPYF